MSLIDELTKLQSEKNLILQNYKYALEKLLSINSDLDNKIAEIIAKFPISDESNIDKEVNDIFLVSDIWNKGITGKNIKVAVIDSNFININNILTFKQIYNPSGRITETYGHGTAVASLIGSKTVGIAPDVELYGCVAEGDLSPEQMSNINKCLRWCIDNEMDIINISQGYHDVYMDSSYNDAKTQLLNLCTEAYNKNIPIVCSAGNDGHMVDYDISIPAAYSNTISIGSVNKNYAWSSFSSTGKSLDFVTFGENVSVVNNDAKTAKDSGTSFAAPIATGIIALIKQQNPKISVKNIYNALLETCTDLGALNKDIFFGNGFIKPIILSEKYLNFENNFLKRNLNITALHSIGIKGNGVKIAIIGYGCCKLDDLNVYKYVNLTTDGASDWISAQSPIGDICTSLIASKTLGIAPESEIYVLRNRNENGWYLNSDVGKDVTWCLNNNIDIIFTDVFINSTNLKKLSDKGIICVMPSLNNQNTSGVQSGQYTNDENAITVSYITPENEYITTPNSQVPFQGEGVDCVAYGYGFEYLNNLGETKELTSSEFSAAYWRSIFAAYEVIGVLALLRQQNPELTNAKKVREILPTICDNLDSSKNNKTGYGLIKATIL